MASDGKLLFDTKLDTSGFKSGLSSLSKMASAAGKGFKSVTNKAVNGIKTGFKVAGAAMGAFGGYSLKAGADFDAAMSQVEAISGASGAQLEALRSKAKEMGATTKFSATQSAEALKYMGMAGWSSEEMLQGLPGVMNLAAASGEDLGLVSDIVTDSLSAFGLEAKDTNRYVDILAATATDSNTSVGLLGESFKHVAPLAGALGYTAEDVSVALGLMANQGVKGSQAGTSLKSALSRLANPTKQVRSEMDRLGISLTDSNGKMKPFNQLMVEMRDKFKGLSEEQKGQAAAAIFGREAMSGMLAILNASDEDFNKLTNSINNSTGAAERMAKTMNDNLVGDFKILISALEGLGIALFEHVDNPFREVVQSVTKQVDKLTRTVETDISKLPQVLGNMIAEGAIYIAEKAPKFIEAGKNIILAFLDGLQANSSRLADSAVKIITSLASAFMEVGAKLFEVGGEILVKLAEGLSANAGVLAPKALEVIGKLAESFNRNAVKLLKVGVDLLKNIAKGLIENPDIVVSAVPPILTALAIAFAAFKGPAIAKKMMAFLAKGLIGEKTALDKSANTIMNSLTQSFNRKGIELHKTGGKLIDKLAKGIASKKTPMLNAGARTIGPLIDGVRKGSGKLTAAGGKIVSFLSKGVSRLGSTKLVTAGAGMIKAIGGGLLGAIGKLGVVAAKIIPLIVSVISNPVGLVVAGGLLIAAIVKGFDLDLNKIANSAGKIVGKVANKIKQGASKLVNVGKSIVNKIGDGIDATKGFFAEVHSKGLISVLGSKLKAGVSKLKDIGKSFIDGIKEGWDENENKVADKARELPDKVNDSVDGSETKPTGENMVGGVVEGLRDGTTDVSTAYNELIKSGVSESDARAIVRQEGQASVEEYARAVYEGSGNVKSAYTAIRTSGLETMEAAEQFFEVAGLNIDGFVNGTEEGGITYREKLQELMDSGMTEIEAVEEITEIAKKNMQGFKDGTASGSEAIAQEFSTMIDMGLTELEAFDEMWTKGQINVDAFGQGSAAGKEAAIGVYQQLRDSGLTQLQAIQAMHDIGLLNIDGFAGGTNEGAVNVEKAYEALKETGMSEANIVEILRGIGAQNTDAFAEGVGSGEGNVSTAYQNTFSNPLEARSSLLFNNANTQGHSTGTNFADGIESSNMDVSTRAQMLGNTAVDNLDGGEGVASGKGQEVGSQYAGGITESQATVDTASTGVGQGAAAALSSQVQAFNNAGKAAMTSYNTAITAGANKVKNSISQMGNAIKSSLNSTSNSVKSSATSMMNFLSSSVRSGANRVNTAFRTLGNNVNSTFRGLSNKVASQSKSMMNKMTSAVSSGSNKVKSKFNQMSSSIKSKMTSTSNRVKSLARSMMNGLVSAISSGSSRARSTISSMCSGMVGTINGYRGAFSGAGANLMAGLAGGIYGGRSGVISAAVSVMRSAVSAAKAAAGIHSPSRVFRDEVGKMLTRGLGEGIADEENFAVNKIKSTMDSIRKKAKGAVLFDNNKIGADLAYSFAGSNLNNKQEVEVKVSNGAVTSVINLDSREIGKAVAPVVSREISKERRRRS